MSHYVPWPVANAGTAPPGSWLVAWPIELSTANHHEYLEVVYKRRCVCNSTEAVSVLAVFNKRTA